MAVLYILHTLQACWGAYSLYLSYISVTKLHKYEERSEKAAEYSNTAEHQLHKTRTTQASGAIAILVSFLSSLTLIYISPSLWNELVLGSVNVTATLSARVHIANFWSRKAKVPFVKNFNDAISITAEIRKQLAYLAGSWIVTSLFGLWSFR